MDAEIHAVDTDRRDSERNILYVRGASSIGMTIKPYEGLPFGEFKDRNFLELEASSWEGPVKSTIIVRLSAGELQQLLDFAQRGKMIENTLSPRLVRLLDQLRDELDVRDQEPAKPDA